MIEARLVCHPVNTYAAISDIAVRVTLAQGDLQLSYCLQADLAQLRIPSPRSGLRADGLWRHCCFEVFVRDELAPDYLEFNFSPSGEWAAYRFRDYRDDPVPAEAFRPPDIRVSQTPDQLELQAVISMRDMQALKGRLQLGLCAVVEASNGDLSYWALKHLSEKPDFHHPDSFVLSLPMDGMT